MRLALVSAAYPPDLDGIGDYTWWLARTLAEHRDMERVVVFTREGRDHGQSPGVEVSPFFDPNQPGTFSKLTTAIENEFTKKEQQLDWLILQYNPFSWGRRGFCPRVPPTLRLLRQTKNAPRLAVMFHETTTPKWPWRFLLMFAYQHPFFKAVCSLADIAFVSTTRWMPQIQRAAPKLPMHHLPVGSNISLRDVSKGEARRKLGIDKETLVLGVFGGAHISRRLDWIAATIAEAQRRHPARRTLLLYVGAEGEAMRQALGHEDMVDCGALPGDEVGVRLRAMDAAISPFVDGVSTRRGSVMALLQHGVPVATTQASWTDDVFRNSALNGLLLSSANSMQSFATETVNWLDRLPVSHEPNTALTEFYRDHFSWQGITQTMLSHLC